MTSTTRLRILVLSSFTGGNANVIRDFLFGFNAHSRHEYHYVFDCGILDEQFDFCQYDAILFFWSLYLPGPQLRQELWDRIRTAPALKVLFLQDEYRDVRHFNQIMERLGINVMCTCVAEKDHDLFYPKENIPSLMATYTVLTGYVPKYLEELRVDRSAPRPLDIGYRSRAVPLYLGDLGQEKTIIARRFQAISEQYGLRSDISVREEDRIYGKQWVEFLKSSRFTLGTGSGASVVDFTGEIRRNCELYLAENPAASYEEVKRLFFADVDGQVVIDTISPRIFESVALGCVLVQHEGDYAGILRPDQHYILVRKDYSNVDQVIAKMRDADFCRQLADNAYRDLIASGAYSYRSFVRWFDAMLDRHVDEPVRRGTGSAIGFYAGNYTRHNQRIVPFHDRYLKLPPLHPSEILLGLLEMGYQRKLLPQNRLLARFFQDPWDYWVKLLFLIRLCLATTSLRRILVAFLKSKQARQRLKLDLVFQDLLRVGILQRVQRGSRKELIPFSTYCDVDLERGCIKVVSRRRQGQKTIGSESTNGRFKESSELPLPELAAAWQDGRIDSVVWDHSAVGVHLSYPMTNSRWITVGLGTGSIHSFTVLMELAKLFPGEVWAALEPIVQGREPFTETHPSPTNLDPLQASVND